MTPRSFQLIVAGSLLLAGCRQLPEAATPPPDEPSATATNTLPVTAVLAPGLATPAIVIPPPPFPTPPENGYSWSFLAARAMDLDGEALGLVHDARAEELQAEVDTTWRDPQLRAGHSEGDREESWQEPGKSGSGSSDAMGWSGGVRLYTASPFVNRAIRREGAARARGVLAESREQRLGVGAWIRELCLEAYLLDKDIACLESLVTFRNDLLTCRREQAEAGQILLRDLIKAESALAQCRAALQEKTIERRGILRHIATLTAIPADQLKVAPPDWDPSTATLSFAEITRLTQQAFAARPDLARLRERRQEAAAALRTARARQIPWFDYMEGGLGGERTQGSEQENAVPGSRDELRRDTEWQIRTAINLPIFSWMGAEKELAREQANAALVREESLLRRIEAEIAGCAEDLQTALADYQRFCRDNQTLRSTMDGMIATLGNDGAPREDLLAAQAEIADNDRLRLRAEAACRRLYERLLAAAGLPDLTPTVTP